MTIRALTQRGRKLLATEFLSGILLIAGGSAVAQALPVLLTPVLTRLYSPEDMALLGLYTAFLSFCANATTLGYSMAIVSGRTSIESGALTAIALIVIGPAATFFSLVFAGLIAFDILGYGELPIALTVVMWLSLILTGVYFSLRYWLVRSSTFGSISRATISQSLGRVGTQVVLGFFSAGWFGLIAGEVVGRGAGFRHVWSSSRQSLTDVWTQASRSKLIETAKEYRKFPLLSAPSAMLNSLSLVLPVPLLTTFFGLHEAGQFSVAYRVLALPLSLVGASVADVFHSRMSRLSREAPARAPRFFFLVAAGLLGVGIVPLVVVGLYGEQLFGLVLGPTWSLAGLIAGTIVPWTLMEFVVGPLSRVVLVYRGQELKLVYDVLAILSVFGCLAFGSSQGWSLIATCTLLAWSQAFVFAVYFVLLIVIMRKYQFVNAAEGNNTYEG